MSLDILSRRRPELEFDGPSVSLEISSDMVTVLLNSCKFCLFGLGTCEGKTEDEERENGSADGINFPLPLILY